jgi:protein ImuB
VHDAHDRQVSVSGRHELSAPPTRVIIDRRRCRVRSWAGPWPIEERWWDGLRRRRIVRMQLVIEDPPQGHKALLVILDNGRWSVSAEYR